VDRRLGKASVPVWTMWSREKFLAPAENCILAVGPLYWLPVIILNMFLRIQYKHSENMNDLREEENEGWRKLHNDKLRNFSSMIRSTMVL
jgi:hypothetical protein